MSSEARTLIAAGTLALLLGAIAVRSSLDEAAAPPVELAVLDLAVPGDPVADLLLDADRNPTVEDDFDGEDVEGLGRRARGERWVDLGNWVTVDGVARLRPTPESSEPFLAIVDVPPGERLVRATMATMDSAAGLVVGYRDADNYWTVVATPAYASWDIWQVVDGQAGVVAKLGPLAMIADGTEIAVHITDEHMDFLLDGRRFTRVNHRLDPDATGVGLAAMRPTNASWDDFAVAMAEPAP